MPYTFQAVCRNHGRLYRGLSLGKAETEAAIHRSANDYTRRPNVRTGVCMTRELFDVLHPDYKSGRSALVRDETETTILMPVIFK